MNKADNISLLVATFFGYFPFVPPVRYANPITEHVPLHSKLLCKNIARASGGCKKYAPTMPGGTQPEKIPLFLL